MGLIAKPNTYSTGQKILAASLNANDDTIYNLVNGNLESANIKELSVDKITDLNRGLFRSYMSKGQLLTSVALSTIAFDSDTYANQFDVGGMYDVTTYRFVPSVAGYYEVACGITMQNRSGSFEATMQLVKHDGTDNIVIRSVGMDSTKTDSPGSLQINDVVYMDGSDDYLFVRADSSVAATATPVLPGGGNPAATGVGPASVFWGRFICGA